MADDGVFVARRDHGQKKPASRAHSSSPTSPAAHRDSNHLVPPRLKLREENTRTIDKLDDFLAYFTPKNEDKPEIHGGFVLANAAEDAEVAQLLGDFGGWIGAASRSIDRSPHNHRRPGNCIFTGKPTQQQVLLAKAYSTRRAAGSPNAVRRPRWAVLFPAP